VGDISALADGIGDLRFGLFSFATPRSARVIWGCHQRSTSRVSMRVGLLEEP
jgi:hypothetical protein